MARKTLHGGYRDFDVPLVLAVDGNLNTVLASPMKSDSVHTDHSIQRHRTCRPVRGDNQPGTEREQHPAVGIDESQLDLLLSPFLLYGRLEAQDETTPRDATRKLRNKHDVERSEDVQLALLRDVARVRQQRQCHFHGELYSSSATSGGIRSLPISGSRVKRSGGRPEGPAVPPARS